MSQVILNVTQLAGVCLRGTCSRWACSRILELSRPDRVMLALRISYLYALFVRTPMESVLESVIESDLESVIESCL